MKLNQFAVYRVDQNTEGKVLWHLPYQEASRQNRADLCGILQADVDSVYAGN